MQGFIKDYTLDNIRHKLLLLYLLNIIDIIFTLILLKTDLFIEANPIIARIINSPDKLFQTKVAIPGLLILYIYFRIKKAKNSQLIISNKIINGALYGYSALNLLHIFWGVAILIL